MSFEFRCSSCGEVHRGMPGFDADAPSSIHDMSESERATRCLLRSDDCVLDGQFYFVRGCIELPVHGHGERFTWGVWASLSETSYRKWVDASSLEVRSGIGPFFGWLNTGLKPYPETVNLKTRVHLRNGGARPFIELEPTNHPLAVEQRKGIPPARVAELYIAMAHAPPHG